MFEPGDWVEVSCDYPDASTGKKKTHLAIVKKSDYTLGGRPGLVVEINEMDFAWTQAACRKLSEHEVMERLTDV